ncbi:glycoside hydrolase superfamily [Nemania serpens]|nr:glycoside hydrolase superfamily [Nemania serpens]
MLRLRAVVGTDFCDSPHPDAPCQQGFGSCSDVAAPSCGGSSALGRSIGYYQVSNNYARECQRISPSQIDTTGLTHLNLAFVSIDPNTFEVVPTDARDVPYYREFTNLKSSTLQTWLSIGGWDFNDPGPTQYTFSRLASTASNRAAFISSLRSFMDEYGFQGVDIDWEYPSADDRSGDPSDTENLVSLVREMRAAFGASYGISATIPASYWYLKWFDPVGMEPYVDFLGLLSYDLHDVGPVIIGQTNIPELANWTLPLWYDQVDPSKINMGLAYYGRGYTVSDVNCVDVGCNWTGPSRPGPCTAFGGVMSLTEIEELIPQIGVDPILDSEAMMKYLVWSDQWIGYDDLETIAMKKAWANSHCFGGTMIWSIDLFSGLGSGDTPDGNVTCSSDPGGSGGQSGSSESGCGGLVYIDPSIWDEPNPVISCQPPCTFILPPLTLSTTTTITFPPYVTSLDVAWSTSTGWTRTVQTTTLTIPPITTTLIPAWSYTVSSLPTTTTSHPSISSTFYPTSSILPPPFVITDDPNPESSPGVTHPPVTRTVTPPPYPYSFTKPDPSDPKPHFPVVTWKPGPPGPPCKSGCGKPCIIFCDHPCLLDCPDGGNDFRDPSDPDPPDRPTPPDEQDPIPTGPPGEPQPEDPEGDDPEDEEEEDEDTFCAYEFSLPPPVYVDPNSGAGPSETISPPAPTPTPHPTPNPEPPKPDPGDMINAVNDFCGNYEGTVLDASDKDAVHTLSLKYLFSEPTGGSGAECFFIGLCDVNINLSVTVTNGCRFTIDGGSANDECGRIFRKVIDQCDTSSTQYKQGGTITSNCAVWRIDPNEE